MISNMSLIVNMRHLDEELGKVCDKDDRWDNLQGITNKTSNNIRIPGSDNIRG